MTDVRQNTDYDVVIAGGGLVGGSLAIALARTNCRVALVEAIPPEDEAQPSFDDRTIALSRGSYRILDQLGLWSRIHRDVWPIHQIHISQQHAFGSAVIDAGEQRVDELGFVIKSRVLGLALWQQIRELPGITLCCPGRVTATGIDDAQPARCVEIETGQGTQVFNTRLLAVADGARSRLRSELGVSADERDYEQVAVVANIQVDPRRAGHIAFERFTSEGPLAVLPGAGGQYTMVLARQAANVQTVLDMPDAELLALLQELLGFRLGRLQRIGARQAYPLYLVTAEDIYAERAAIIGNAAHGLHPVAAQGFNLGLRDVAGLAETIADGFSADPTGFDAGSASALESYARWRRDDQRKVVEFTDGLIRLFGVPGDVAAMARGLSLSAFDILPAAKRELARQTMGLAGRMSRLARGLPL